MGQASFAVRKARIAEAKGKKQEIESKHRSLRP